MIRSRHAPLWAMLLILLLAAFARFHNIEAQSLWYDEGAAYGHSQRSLPALIEAVRNNVHVPFYFAALALWEDLTGGSEFSLRAFSALASIGSVALAYALGRRLYAPLAGLTAALLVALNGFSVTYGQEARMYGLLGLLAGLAMWLFVGFVRQPAQRGRLAVGLAIVHSIGALTHISFALVLLAQGIMALWWLIAWAWSLRRLEAAWWRALAYYVLANGVMLLAILPWAGNLLNNAEAQPDLMVELPLTDFLRIVQGWLSFGPTYAEALGGMGIVIVFFALFGLIVRDAEAGGDAWGMALPVVWVLVSVALYYQFGLYERYLRFLIGAQVGMALWLARGAWVLWGWRTRDKTPPLSLAPRFAALFALGALAYQLIGGLNVLATDAAYQRADWRGLVQYSARHLSADDALIVGPSGLQEIVGYYYTGDAPLYALPRTRETLAEDARAIVASSQQIRTIFYGVEQHDPQNILRRTLAETAYPVAERWWDDMRSGHYWVGTMQPAQPVGAALGDWAVLEEAALNAESFLGGEVLALRLLWRASSPSPTPHAVFVQLLDAEGRLVAQRDSAPLDGFAPTDAWQAGQTIEDHHALWLVDAQDAPLPAGRYALIVGLYDPRTGQRVPAPNGADALRLAEVTIR